MSSAPPNRFSVLPLNLPPRLVGREAAAAYQSISPSQFDEMVRDGRMPKPEPGYGRRKLWDLRKIDAAIDCLSDLGSGDDGSWKDVDDAP